MAYGLTLNQAKIYFAMVQTNADTIKKISDSSGLALESIYRAMPSLEEMQLVEKIFSAPSKFKALPPAEACKLLKERDKKERFGLYNQTDSLVKKLVINKAISRGCNENDTVLISGYEAFTRRLGSALQDLNNTFYGITNMSNFRIGMLNNGRFYEKLVRKGIKCYHIVQLSKNLHLIPLGDDHLINNECWRRKFVKEDIVEFAIIDKKQLFLSLTVPQQGKKHRAIYTTNPSLLAMAMSYFEMLWTNSSVYHELVH